MLIFHNKNNAIQSIFLSLLVSLASSSALAAQPPADTVVGPIKCAECHKIEARIWEGTHHFKTYTALPRSDKAREVADRMGIKRIKAESLCLSCHFTTQVVDGSTKAMAGISCESCHGGARDWQKRHSEFSGNEKKENETAAERGQRWKDAEAAGMIRPQNIYRLAKNCYSCHVVPQEKLVNVGGHPAGSPFELVSWSQGEIRHNSWHTADRSNLMASAERRRQMFVVGTAVEIEVSLRAVATATQKNRYAVSMAKRAKAAGLRMKKIAATIDTPEATEIVAIVGGVALKLNNADALNAAADKVAAAAKKLASNSGGSGWAGIDSMIPGAEHAKGRPVEVPASIVNNS